MRTISFALIVVWTSLTIMVDFIVIPNVFQNIPNFFMAGNLGVILFNKFNLIEFPISSMIFLMSITHFEKTKSGYFLILSSILLLAIASSYLFYLTPKLTHLTAIWEYAEKMGTLGSGKDDVQSLHMFYHQAYRWLDTVKLLLLFSQGVVLGLFLSKKTR
jgi:hypothetical protein